MLARLDLLACFLRNGRHAVSYQAQLDRMKAARAAEENMPLSPPPLGASSSWDRNDLVNLARAEIDNTVRILEIIEVNDERVFDRAAEDEAESNMRLSTRLSDHLRTKIQTMNSHWVDYDRLSPPANP